MLQVLELLGVGLIVGLAGGTLGVGGGFILVPVLYTVLGWPLVSAVATSHFCGMAVSTSASGNYAGAGLIDWRLGVIMEAAAVVGSATGAFLMKWISTPVVALLFCAVVALAAVRMRQPPKGTASWFRSALLLLWTVPRASLFTAGFGWLRRRRGDPAGWLAMSIGIFLVSLWIV